MSSAPVGFRAAVQDAKIGPDKDIPHVTAPIIVKYITTCSCSDCYRATGSTLSPGTCSPNGG